MSIGRKGKALTFLSLVGVVSSAIGRDKKPKKRSSLVVVTDDEGKVLLGKRSSTDKWMPNHWGVFGGGVDEGESFEEGAVREIFEETHLRVNPDDLHFIRDVRPGLKLFITDKYSGEVSLEEASHGFEHSDFGWFTTEEIEELQTVPNIWNVLS